MPGFFLWLMYITQTFGLLFTTASNSGFISSLYVVFVPVFSFFLFRKLPTSQKWVSAIVAMCGLFLLTGGLTGINAGDALTLACALASAAQIIYSDKYVKGGTNPVVLAFQQFFVVGMLSLAVAFIFSLPFSIGSAQAGMSIAFLTIFPTLSAYVIQLIAQKRTDPVKVGLILSFESVFAAVFAWTLGGERFDAIKAIGGILVFGALVFSEVPLDKIKKLFSKSKPARSGGHG